MRKLAVLLLSIGLSLPSIAQPRFQLKDYAWKAGIDESSATLQRIDLSVEILRGMSHRRAADIAVFDANGQSLPTLLRPKLPLSVKKWTDLKFQRFERRKAGQGATLILDQQQIDSEDGQATRLGIRQQVQLQQQHPDYIIELDKNQLELGIEAIELDWLHQPAADFLKLDIQAANDIDNWTTVQRGKNLFKGQGRDGDWVSLTGLPAGYRYFRLRPQDSVTSFELISARGAYQVEQEIADLVVAEESLAEDAKHPGFFAFSLPLQVDARALRFVLPDGSFLSGSLYSSLAGFDKKRVLRREIEQHNLQGMDKSDKVTANFTQEFSYWFEPKQTILDGVSLEFFYPAYEILYINNQQGPFTLAWGNYEVEQHPDELSSLVHQQQGLDLVDAEEVSTGSTRAAGGKQRQIPAEVKPWLTWSLWALLTLAVVITSRMAWTLYRDMNR